MDFWSLLAVAVGLSMDAFAVSVGKGLTAGRADASRAVCVGLWFGSFQFLMPLAGYLIASLFSSLISAVSAYVAFGLLALIGLNMIREALGKDEEDLDGSLGVRTMFLLAVATSIDALAVGVTFAFLEEGRAWIGPYAAAGVIGCTTFLLSALGVKLGGIFGSRYQKKAELAGGVILILLGLRILLKDLLGG